MYSTFDHLRRIAALAHHVPGVRVELLRRRRRPLRIGLEADVDVDTCTFRQMLMARTCASGSAAATLVTDIVVSGAFEPVAGDLYRVDDEGSEQRWFATMLAPALVADVLEHLECDPEVGAAVSATLKPDQGLGITSVCISVDDLRLERDLDDLALDAYCACVVEELVVQGRSGTTSDPADQRDRR